MLIDGLTTSAAAQFGSLVKLNGRAILVGEDAPGSLHGGSGRGYNYFLLPNSGLLTMISLYRLYFSPANSITNDTVVIANHWSSATIDALLKGLDQVMIYTFKLINESK